MIAALEDNQRLTLHPIDQPMFAVDAAGPEAGIVATERFGFARALEWVAPTFADQAVKLSQHGAVTLLPVDVLLERVGEEEDLHSFS